MIHFRLVPLPLDRLITHKQAQKCICEATIWHISSSRWWWATLLDSCSGRHFLVLPTTLHFKWHSSSNSHCIFRKKSKQQPHYSTERGTAAHLLQISKVLRGASLCHVTWSSCRYDAAYNAAIVQLHAYCNWLWIADRRWACGQYQMSRRIQTISKYPIRLSFQLPAMLWHYAGPNCLRRNQYIDGRG